MGKTITAKEARGVAEHTIMYWSKEQIKEYDKCIREASRNGKFDVEIFENNLIDGTKEYFVDLGYDFTVRPTHDPREEECYIKIAW